MIQDVCRQICKTEDCRILNDHEFDKIDYLKQFKEVIEVRTEISNKVGVIELILYIGFIDKLYINIPKIIINHQDYKKLGYIPHINFDYSICIYDEQLNYIFEGLSLPNIVEGMIHRAKFIISQVDFPDTFKLEFEREFHAYWNIFYSQNDEVTQSGISLVNDMTGEIKGLYFNKEPYSGYRYLIYNESEASSQYMDFLKFIGVSYNSIELFETNYDNVLPPFNLTFKDSISFIHPDDIDRFRRSINANGFDSVLTYFKKNEFEIFGWVYHKLVPPTDPIKMRFKSMSNWEIISNFIYQRSEVTRLTFSNLLPKRLQLRTSGSYIEKTNTISLVGLGSVGSNLLNYLNKLNVINFHLVDPDLLKVENIFRNQYGFNSIGLKKVDIAKYQLVNKNPFSKVLTFDKSIEDVLNNDPLFFNKTNYNFIVVGLTRIEKYIIQHLIETKCDKPLIIIWVEPFLASGQMLYINPLDFPKAIELLMDFPYKALENNEISATYFKEGSCQTGYYPYSEENLSLFLSSINLHISQFLHSDGVNPSQIFSFMGDKELLKNKGISLSEFGHSCNSFELKINVL